MRIGIMLRAYDRPGGIGIYARNIVKHLLKHDSENDYVLFYNHPQHIGTYADRPGVTEVCIPKSNQFVWDQWYVARETKQRGIDLLFNTKFSVPLFTKAKRVMALHGASWYVHPELYTRADIAYVKLTMPRYCAASDFLISNSELTTQDFIRILGVSPERIRTILLAAGEDFRPVDAPETLEATRKKYNLPQTFVLTVTSYDPRKNFGTLIKAFETARKQMDLHLVVIGKDCHKYAEAYDLSGRGLTDAVHFPGWVDQADLPAIYSLAASFAFPSVYEEFGIPVVEAMSCGCPIASSSTGAIPGLTAGAALLADPFDADALASNILTLSTETEVRAICRQKGLDRARDFSWDTTARMTLDIFRKVMETPTSTFTTGHIFDP